MTFNFEEFNFLDQKSLSDHFDQAYDMPFITAYVSKVGNLYNSLQKTRLNGLAHGLWSSKRPSDSVEVKMNLNAPF